mmetsp:Transcript_153745/g.268905  ORF Transcript_153745/g.268905 Transcript_153745/m.268905 type:complete len:622 (-) Transcript_153745:2062-3927(-)
MSDASSHNGGTSKPDEDPKEDLEHITLADLKERYMRYRKRTDEWKEKMKSIAMKERSQLTITTDQLRTNTKILRETTERLEAKEKDCVQLEKDKEKLLKQVQELNKMIRNLKAQRDSQPDVLREQLEEKMVEEMTHKLDIGFQMKRLQLETQYKQQIAQLKREHEDVAGKLERDLTLMQRERDDIQSKHDDLVFKAQNQHETHQKALEDAHALNAVEAKREGEREAGARVRDLEHKIHLLEKDRLRVSQEYEQYKVRSQTAFKKSKADEKELAQQKNLTKYLQQQLSKLQTDQAGRTKMSDGPEDSAAMGSAEGPQNVMALQRTVEELQQKLSKMDSVYVEADAKLVELTERLQSEADCHRAEMQTLQTEYEELKQRHAGSDTLFKQQLEQMDARFGKEITRLQGLLKSKSTSVAMLCEQLGIQESQIGDGAALKALKAARAGSQGSSTQDPPIAASPPPPAPPLAMASVNTMDLDLSLGVGTTSDFDFQSFVSTSGTDPNVSAQQLSEFQERQIKRLAAQLESTQDELQISKNELQELQASEVRHIELEKLLKEDIRQLRMTTYTEESWTEKRNYLKHVILKFIEARQNEEVQSQMVHVISTVLAFTPIELQMVQRSYKK